MSPSRLNLGFGMEPTGFSLAPRTFLDRALEPMESSGCEWYLWLCPGCNITSAQGHCSCAQDAISLLRVTAVVPRILSQFYELHWVCGWRWAIGEQFQINKDNNLQAQGTLVGPQITCVRQSNIGRAGFSLALDVRTKNWPDLLQGVGVKPPWRG